MNKILFAFLGIMATLPSFGITVSGHIVDADGAVPDAIITQCKTGNLAPESCSAVNINGTQADSNGYFTLADVDEARPIYVQSIGYQTKQVTPSQNLGDIELEYDNTELDASVVSAEITCSENKEKGIATQSLGTDGKCHPTKCVETHWKLVGQSDKAKCEPVCPTIENAAEYTDIQYDADNNTMTCKVKSCKGKNYVPNDDRTACERTDGPCTTEQINAIEHAESGNQIRGVCYPTACKDNWNLVGNGKKAKCQAPCPAIEHATQTQVKSYDDKTNTPTCTVKKCESGWAPNADKTACERTDGPCTAEQIKTIKYATKGEMKNKKCYATECADGYEPNDGGICISSAELAELESNARAMREKEQSFQNRMLGAAGIASVGAGLQKTLSGMAEQQADANAEQDMRAYLATFTCSYGGGKQHKLGNTNIEVPLSANMFELYQEYTLLANNLKITKESLGLKPGIESEVVIDKASTGLYDDVAVGKTGGGYPSIARAILNPDGEDAKKWQEQVDAAKKKTKTGAITAGAGAVGTAVANIALNSDKDKQNKVDEIKQKYSGKVQNIVKDAPKSTDSKNETDDGTIDKPNNPKGIPR